MTYKKIKGWPLPGVNYYGKLELCTYVLVTLPQILGMLLASHEADHTHRK